MFNIGASLRFIRAKGENPLMIPLKELELRKKYPEFIYESYKIEKNENSADIEFSFKIKGLCEFHPKISIKTDNLTVLNDCKGALAEKIVFNMGMCEAVSYFKCVCPEKITVKCGALSKADKAYWRHLWFNGLGEFFYINSIAPGSEDTFIEIDAPEKSGEDEELFINLSGKNIIPVGGGKDSCVTAHLLRSLKDENLFFTVNDQKARTDCVEAAGYTEKSIIKAYRTIDSELLGLNKKGFLNGHTPFSAVVAFLSLYCAYLVGGENIILSNEASANEGNTDGGVNHQYSKSFDFEYDFNEYVKRNFTDKIKYFSLLRPFNELQITKMFSACPEFRTVFRSCNRGSKRNVWCEECSKCLFVYGMLSAFLSDGEMREIFSSNMLDNEALLKDFRGLTGLDGVKPFECVGTAEEYKTALSLAVCKRKKEGKELPRLLKLFDSEFDAEKIASETKLFSELNGENLVPEKFREFVLEMYSYVKNCRVC